MNFRSSNTAYTHFGGDLVSNVESSHGVMLTGGSTGGVVQPVGDDANITLKVAGKGTGETRIGNSSSPVVLSTGTTLQVGSTAPFAGFVRVTSTGVATPNFNSTGLFGIVSTHTIAGVNSSHYVFANPTNLSTAVVLSDVWAGSTDGSVNLKWNKLSTVTIAASTATIRFLVVRF